MGLEMGLSQLQSCYVVHLLGMWGFQVFPLWNVESQVSHQVVSGCFRFLEVSYMDFKVCFI